MALFEDKKSKEKIEYLEEERRKLWGRLTQLEKDHKDLQQLVGRKATDDEKEAAQSSRKAAEFRNKTEQRFEEANNFVKVIEDYVQLGADKLAEISKLENDVLLLTQAINEIKLNVETTEVEIFDNVRLLEKKIQTFNDFFEQYPDLNSQLEEVDGHMASIADNVSKSTITVTQINKRKQDIDTLYREVFGYSETDEDGNESRVEGLKDELDESYKKLEEKLEEAFETIKTLSENSHKSFADFQKSHKEKYDAITLEITSLLPNALTAGLSSAFSKKKGDEEKSAIALQSKFTNGIYLLVAVSILPFIVSAYFLYHQVPLNEVINRLPRLVLAIVPMYVPVLWFTYSANKKLNLSKRLIEEYSHKEVLSKTYEGLSKQITGLNNDEQSLELKYRLLSNFLQVSSENPGKLISNYEASDHPVMEALEQSYKFQIALDKLDSIPGLGKVAAMLESRAKKKMGKKAEIIDKALNFGDSSEAEEEQET